MRGRYFFLTALLLALAVMLLPAPASASETHGPWTCPVDQTFYSSKTNACYKVKGKCDPPEEVRVQRVYNTLTATISGDPSCQVSSLDSLKQWTKLEGKCESDGEKQEVEVKRDDKLCTPCCAKPDKATGCTFACP